MGTPITAVCCGRRCRRCRRRRHQWHFDVNCGARAGAACGRTEAGGDAEGAEDAEAAEAEDGRLQRAHRHPAGLQPEIHVAEAHQPAHQPAHDERPCGQLRLLLPRGLHPASDGTGLRQHPRRHAGELRPRKLVPT